MVRSEQGSSGATGSSTQATSASSTLATAAAVEGARQRSQDQDAPGSAPAEGLALTPRQTLEMRAYRNARYHDDRLAHFERLNRWSNFILVVLGSGAFAGVVQAVTNSSSSFSYWGARAAILGTFLSAVLGACQLAFDWSAKARAHSELKRAFAKIMAKAANPDCDVDKVTIEMHELYGDEFEIYHAVNALAYNAAQRAFGRPAGAELVVSRWQAFMRNVFHFQGVDFKTADEAKRLVRHS